MPPVPDNDAAAPDQRWRRFVRPIALCLLGGLAVAAVAARLIPRASGGTESAILTAVNRIQVLKPEAMVGQRFPLRLYIDTGARLGTGHWMVILYRPDCDDCRRALPRYEALALRHQQHPELPAMALVEVPPYAPPARSIVNPNSGALLGKLSADREWFVQTPVMMELLDGKVVAVKEGKDAEFPPGWEGGNKQEEGETWRQGEGRRNDE